MKLRLALVLLAGILLGILLQRFLGVGNLLNRLPFMQRPPRMSEPLSADLIPPEQHGQLLLFVMAGQSNMAGMGKLPYAVPKPVPNTFVFGNDYRWRPAFDPVDDAVGQVDTVSQDNLAGVSPGIGFAEALQAQQKGLVVGLIPCAKNASEIAAWQRNLSDTTLYGSCLKRTRAASTLGRVAGVLFFQGEADALPGREASAPRWSNQFAAFVHDFRRDLDQPELPVVFAQLAANEAALPYWETIQQQQSAVALPNCKMIITRDLPLADGLHFTPASYRIVGQRFAAAWWELGANQKPNKLF